MIWTPPKNFEEVQIAMEELYKLMKSGGNGTSTPQTTVLKPGYKSVVVDTFGDLVDENDEVVNIPEDTNIFKTLSQFMAPSSYFIDLRGYYVTTTTRRFTAETLVLHDRSTPWKTMAVTDVDITNNVSTAGPIINGRDQAGAFTSDSYVHFYAYWDAKFGKVASLSSASATNPMLPDGSTYFMRIGSSYWTTFLWAKSQVMERIWQSHELFSNAQPGAVDTWVEVTNGEAARCFPATAKTAFGLIGNSTTSGAVPRGIAIATNVSGDNYFQGTVTPGAPAYFPNSAIYFHIPIEDQKIFWEASVDSAIFYAIVKGYTDDL